MKPIQFEYDGQIKYGYAQKISGVLWLHIDGKTYSLKPEGSEYESAQANETLDPTKIVAPMPGKIMKLHIKPGQTLTANSDTLAMEAMKMEYVLKCSVDCKVKAINCQEGDQVELGQALVELEVVDG